LAGRPIAVDRKIIRAGPEISRLRVASRLVSDILMRLDDVVSEGVSTAEISKWCEKEIARSGAESAARSTGFPAAVCTSVNEVAVHGIPGARILYPGDIVTVDISVKTGGWYGDGAATFGVYPLDPVVEKLLKASRAATMAGIEAIRPGLAIGGIGRAIYNCARKYGFSVISSCVGHGIGKALHESPIVPSSIHEGEGLTLQEGMIFTVEPVITIRESELKDGGDGWSKVTVSGLPTAQWEHTVLVTGHGAEILTLSRPGKIPC
jgi:methionyl aminopeptidase